MIKWCVQLIPFWTGEIGTLPVFDKIIICSIPDSQYLTEKVVVINWNRKTLVECYL